MALTICIASGILLPPSLAAEKTANRPSAENKNNSDKHLKLILLGGGINRIKRQPQKPASQAGVEKRPKIGSACLEAVTAAAAVRKVRAVGKAHSQPTVPGNIQLEPESLLGGHRESLHWGMYSSDSPQKSK
jgi:hypothetical protein